MKEQGCFLLGTGSTDRLFQQQYGRFLRTQWDVWIGPSNLTHARIAELIHLIPPDVLDAGYIEAMYGGLTPIPTVRLNEGPWGYADTLGLHGRAHWTGYEREETLDLFEQLLLGAVYLGNPVILRRR